MTITTTVSNERNRGKEKRKGSCSINTETNGRRFPGAWARCAGARARSVELLDGAGTRKARLRAGTSGARRGWATRLAWTQVQGGARGLRAHGARAGCSASRGSAGCLVRWLRGVGLGWAGERSRGERESNRRRLLREWRERIEGERESGRRRWLGKIPGARAAGNRVWGLGPGGPAGEALVFFLFFL
jgi:hypothetical protein